MGVLEFITFAAMLTFVLAFFKLASRAALRDKELKYQYQNSVSEERLAKLEQRIQNLETIVIEHAKKSEFERL